MNTESKMKQFPFVQGLLAKEPHVYDILSEIVKMQELSLPDGKHEMATLQFLQSSRNIPIPFTTSRNNQISYLVTQLCNAYPNHVQKLITFTFNVEKKTKKLVIKHKMKVAQKNNNIERIKELFIEGTEGVLSQSIEAIEYFIENNFFSRIEYLPFILIQKLID